MKSEHITTDEQIAALREELRLQSLPSMNKKRKYESVMKGIANAAFTLVLVALIVALVSVQVTKERGETPYVAGFALYTVQTGSMEPTLPVGSVTLNRRVTDVSELEVGDIVTFVNTNGVRVTHRIVEIVDSDGQIAFKTKGDSVNNDVDSELLTADRVESIVLRRVR